MNNLFDYGEFLLCFGPVFLVIMLVFLALVWNNLPSRTVGKKKTAPAAEPTADDDIRTN